MAELQQIAEYLRLPISYFLDEGVGRVGQREQLQSQFERFSELPDDVREFVSHYTNLPYLRVAVRISDMDADRIESKDLAGRMPDRVKMMSEMYDRWAKRCGVEPWPVKRGTGN